VGDSDACPATVSVTVVVFETVVLDVCINVVTNDVVVCGTPVVWVVLRSSVCISADAVELTGSVALTALVSCITAFFDCLAASTAVKAVDVVVSAVYPAVLVVDEVAFFSSAMVVAVVSVRGISG
jgi:hypothetical protein